MENVFFSVVIFVVIDVGIDDGGNDEIAVKVECKVGNGDEKSIDVVLVLETVGTDEDIAVVGWFFVVDPNDDMGIFFMVEDDVDSVKAVGK